MGRVPLVRCMVDSETLRCLPRAWTDRRPVDAVERVSALRVVLPGRSCGIACPG